MAVRTLQYATSARYMSLYLCADVYHCTEGRGRCDDPYVREERLLRELDGAFQQLVIAPATLSWLQATVTQSDKTEPGAREQAVRVNQVVMLSLRYSSTVCPAGREDR